MSEISPDSLSIAGPRKRGRPPVSIPHERLSTWIPVTSYDRLVKRAAQEDKKLAALVRDVLHTYLARRDFPS